MLIRKKNITRAIPILLILVFAYNIFGYLLYFNVERYFIREHVKREISQGFSDKNYVIVVFGPNNKINLEWIEEDEFKLNGERYDVVKKQIAGNSISYYCVKDGKEDKLFANFEQKIKEESIPFNKKLNQVFKVYPVYYYKEKNNVSFLLNTSFFTLKQNVSSDYLSVKLEIFTPPPDNLLAKII